jgi:hypothetical protein
MMADIALNATAEFERRLKASIDLFMESHARLLEQLKD